MGDGSGLGGYDNKQVRPPYTERQGQTKKGIHSKCSLVNQCVQWGHFQEHDDSKIAVSQKPVPTQGPLTGGTSSGLPVPHPQSSLRHLQRAQLDLFSPASHGCLSNLGKGTCEPCDFQDCPETCRLCNFPGLDGCPLAQTVSVPREQHHNDRADAAL